MSFISIVIPTKNSGKSIRKCLESIRNQTYQSFELIVVDGFSKDDTVEICKEFTDKIFVSDKSLPACRNIGFSNAKGDIFMSIDSDMILQEKMLEEVAEKMDGNGELIISEIGYGNDFVSKCKDLEKRCYIGDELVESARAFSRKAFEAVGGYDESLLFGEDWDIHERIQSRFKHGRIDARIMHNTENLCMIHNLKKAYGYGKSLPIYFSKERPRDKWLNPTKIFFARHFSKLKKEPVTALGLTVIKGMEYGAGLAGVISYKLGSKK